MSSGYWLSPQPPSVGMTGIIGRSSVGEPSRWSLYAANGGGATGHQLTTNPTGAIKTCQKSTWSTTCMWRRRGANPTALAKSFDYSDVEIYLRRGTIRTIPPTSHADRTVDIFSAMAAFAKSCDHSDLEIYMPPDRDARGRTG